MKKALSIIMALVIIISTFSVMASAYTFGSYITDDKILLEPGSTQSDAQTFALGERVYGIIEEYKTAYYRFTPTTDYINFSVKTSDMIDVTIFKNGSSDKYTLTVNDSETKSLKLDKGAIYFVQIELASAAIDRDYGTMTTDAVASAEYCFSTSYTGMPTSTPANINFKEAVLSVGESLLLELKDINIPNLNIFWRVYDDPTTIVKETDVATVSDTGLVTIKMNNNSFVTDTTIKVQAVWYYGEGDGETTKTCTVKALAANISLDPYYDTNTRKLYTGVGGFVNITAKSNLKDRGILWTSEDPSIATVTPDGKITGVAVGQTIVKVTIFGTSITRRIEVNVLEGHNSVIGVKLSENEASVRVNEDYELSHTITVVNPDVQPSNPKVAYISSDPSIATVDKTGKITGVSEGEVTITVLTEDGNFKDTCKVKVKAAIPNWLMVVVAPLRIIINFLIMIFGGLSK